MNPLNENTPPAESPLPSTAASPAVKHNRENPWPQSIPLKEFADGAAKAMVKTLNERTAALPDLPEPKKPA